MSCVGRFFLVSYLPSFARNDFPYPDHSQARENHPPGMISSVKSCFGNIQIPSLISALLSSNVLDTHYHQHRFAAVPVRRIYMIPLLEAVDHTIMDMHAIDIYSVHRRPILCPITGTKYVVFRDHRSTFSSALCLKIERGKRMKRHAAGRWIT